MDNVSVDSISVGVPFPCAACGDGRINKIESAGRDYKVWCRCGTKHYVTISGKVFRSGVHHDKVR